MHPIVVFQQFKHPLRCNQAHLQGVKFISQHPDRPVQHGDVQRKSHQNTDGYFFRQYPTSAVPHHQTQGKRRYNVYHRKKNGVSKNSLQVGCGVIAVDLAKFICLAGFSIKYLYDAHAADPFLQKSIHRGNVVAHFFITFSNTILEFDTTPDQQRKYSQYHKGQFPGSQKHHHQYRNDGEQIGQNGDAAFTENGIDRLNIANGTGGALSNRRTVEIAEVQAVYVVKNLHPQVADRRLAQPVGMVQKKVPEHDFQHQQAKDSCCQDEHSLYITDGNVVVHHGLQQLRTHNGQRRQYHREECRQVKSALVRSHHAHHLAKQGVIELLILSHTALSNYF